MFFSERKDVAKEQIKLVANTVNALGIAIVVIGLVRPFVMQDAIVIADSIAVILIGGIIHAISLRILTKMPEDD